MLVHENTHALLQYSMDTSKQNSAVNEGTARLMEYQLLYYLLQFPEHRTFAVNKLNVSESAFAIVHAMQLLVPH